MAAYAAKKAKSKVIFESIDMNCEWSFYLEPALVAKSNIILDVKPWDDETGEWHALYGIGFWISR